jgi:integrase
VRGNRLVKHKGEVTFMARFKVNPNPESVTETAAEELARLVAERARIQESHFSQNTVLTYGFGWRMFCAWCEERGRPPLPASEDTVSLYLTDLLSRSKVSTALSRNCAIIHQHRVNKFPSPVTKGIVELLNCAQRQRVEKPRRVRALALEDLRAISAKLLTMRGTRYSRFAGIPTDVALRDRAIMVVGFTSALRRSNIAALLLSDVEFTGEGMVLHINREKQDQKGNGRSIGLPYGKHPDTCPVLVLRDWLKRGRNTGPLFPRLDRNYEGQAMNGDGESIARIVKKCVKLIGLNWTDYAGHSLRAGFVTAAGEANIGILQIAAHTGHSVPMVERYFRKSDPFRNNVCGAMDF